MPIMISERLPENILLCHFYGLDTSVSNCNKQDIIGPTIKTILRNLTCTKIAI